MNMMIFLVKTIHLFCLSKSFDGKMNTIIFLVKTILLFCFAKPFDGKMNTIIFLVKTIHLFCLFIISFDGKIDTFFVLQSYCQNHSLNQKRKDLDDFDDENGKRKHMTAEERSLARRQK